MVIMLRLVWLKNRCLKTSATHNGYYVVLNNKNRQYNFIKCLKAAENRYNKLDLLKTITKRSYFSRPKSVNFM